MKLLEAELLDTREFLPRQWLHTYSASWLASSAKPGQFVLPPVKLGFTTLEKVDECLRLQEKMKELGADTSLIMDAAMRHAMQQEPHLHPMIAIKAMRLHS